MSGCTEKVIVASGSFGRMQDLIGNRLGALTRVGDTAGDVSNATSSDHGNPAEAIDVKPGCPVSRALAGVPVITPDASLIP